MNIQPKMKTLLAAGVALVLVGAAALVLVLVREPSADAHAHQIVVGTDQPDAEPGAPHDDGLAAADLNGDGVVYQDGMHPWIVQDEPGQCPICGMDLMPVQVGASEDGVVAIDPVTLQNIGVRTAMVTVEPLERSLRTTGRFEMDEQAATTVSLKVSGWIEKLHVDFTGAIVRQGQPLLELYSPELVTTQEDYLLALRNVGRLQGGPGEQDARRLLDAARQRLAYWDLTSEQIHRIETAGEPQRTITFFAPASGEVMNKQVVEGQYVEAGSALMTLVDISNVWLMIDVYEQDLAWVKVGQQVQIELPYDPGSSFTGRVDHIYRMLQTDTRTARARVTLQAGHQAPFKPGMFATVTLRGGAIEPGPIVPEEAVVQTGGQDLVILALGGGRFRPVDVVTGLQVDGRVQILQGLAGGERVVTSAQFLIDSEARLQSTIGAMVAGHEHGGTFSQAGGGE